MDEAEAVVETDETQNELRIVVTPERMGALPLNVYYALGTSARASVDYIAHFVVGDDGQYLPKAAALLRVFEGRTLADVSALVDEVHRKLAEAAVPN